MRKETNKEKINDDILSVVEQFLLHFEEADKKIKKKEEDKNI